MNSPQRTSLLRPSFKAGLISILLLLGSLSAQAQTRFVSTTGTNANPASATSWATSTTDLQGAINASATGDQVWVAAGMYKPTSTTVRTVSFAMKNRVSILGGFAGSGPTPDTRSPLSTTLSGDIGTPDDNSDNSHHVIFNTSLDATARLDNFVIEGGNAGVAGNSVNNSGGGMYNAQGSSPTITNCLFTNNTASYRGGGVLNEGGIPILTNCIFRANTCTYNGGGLYNAQSSPIITNCSFLNNAANGAGVQYTYGGAMYNDGINGLSSPTITNCLFKGNSSSSGHGGAIVNNGSYGVVRPRFTNCSFQDNSATIYGGAMLSDGSVGVVSVTLTNCSFQNNSAPIARLFFNSGYNNGAVDINLTNCVVFGNGSYTIYNAGNAGVNIGNSLLESTLSSYNTTSANLSASASPFASTTGTQLASGSSAINAGSIASYSAVSASPTDLAGNCRIVGGGLDMGAYEFQSGSPDYTITLVTQPVAGSLVCPGGTVTVSVGVTGVAGTPGAAYTYQWYKDGTLLSPVQSTSVLSFTNVQVSDAGNYSVVIEGGCNSLTSNAFSLTVLPAPSRLYVKASATGANTGLTWTDAFTDLQSALNYPCSASLTEIWVASGSYKPTTTTGPDSRTVSFSMKNGVGILGGFAGSGPTPDTRSPLSSTLSGEIGTAGVNADNSYHVIYNTGLDATARLDNFVITGGNANGTFTATIGGGMYNIGSSPRLTNCLFQRNTATLNGGAMYNSSGSGIASPTLINCAFLTNSANEGGAIYNSANNGTASPMLTNCSFGSNSATEGGAIANFRSTGAAREATQARLAAAGTANPVLTNCVVFGNGGNKTFRNVNSATVTATYSLFDDSVTGYITDPTNLTTSTTPYAASLISTRLAPGAPAIDSGNSAATGLVGITTDLDNNPRIVGCRVDMGANEFQANTNQALTITNQPAAGSAVCAGGAVTASVSVTGTVTGYQWVKGGALISPAQTTSALSLTNVQVGDTGSYSVVITGACNLVTSSAFSLIVNALPAPTLTAINGLGVVSTTLTCAQTNLTLTATGGTSGGTFSYTFAGPGISNTDPMAGTATVNQPGTVTLTVTNANGCIQSTTLAISQSTALPLPGLLSSGTLTCSQTSGTLTATGGTQYRFSGPGIVSQNTSAGTALVDASGTYSVTVIDTVTGCSSVTSTTVISNTLAPSISVFPISGTLTCNKTSLTLTASGTGTSYYWVEGANGPRSAGAGLTVTNAGTYNLTAIGANGCISTTSVVISQDVRVPVGSLVSDGPLTCTKGIAQLTASGGDAYVFSGPGLLTTLGRSATVNVSGTYSVTIINTSTGCSSITSTTVISNTTAPGAILSANPSTTLTCVLAGLTLTGSSSDTGSLAYTFSGPSGLIGSSGNTRPVSQSGVYSLTVTNTNTGCYSTTTLTISQNNSGVQSLNLTLSLQSVNCEAPRAMLVATPGASRYRFTGPGIDQTSSANILPVSVAGTYSATALFGGCFAAASLSTGAGPTVLLLGNGTLSCATPTVSLSVLGSGAGTVFSGPLSGSTGIVSQSDGIERTFVNGYLICRTPLPAFAWAIVNQPGVYRVRIVGANGLESGATITVTGQACPAGGR